MATELTLETGTLYAFLLVLTRISGAFIFIPLPGIKAGPEMTRAVLALSLTFVLFPAWPKIDGSGVGLGLLIWWLLAEAGIGIGVGLTVAFLMEGFQVGAQIINLQAGYSFATTIDPNSGADSPVLLAIAELSAGLLFFATGLDRKILLALAHSLATQPPGHFAISPSVLNALIKLGSMIFITGLRLILPVLGLLLMVEISVALLARLNSQLHLMMLTFPLKMLLALVLLSWLIAIFPTVFSQVAGPVFDVIRRLLSS
ncbi:MAG TPA: flagellar biosynthetic protein FliR [Bryobacteraceae bacterium]|nr:flagellar biosynthetic protein FliR [Bryobacteraceae bacterium]